MMEKSDYNFQSINFRFVGKDSNEGGITETRCNYDSTLCHLNFFVRDFSF